VSSSTVLCLPVPAPGAPERLVGGETTRGTITDVVEPVLFEFVVVDVPNSDGVSFLENGPVDRSFGTERIRVLKMPTDGLYSAVVSGYEGASGFAVVVVDVPLGAPGYFCVVAT